MRATLVVVLRVVFTASLCGTVVAGSIDSPGLPSAGSGMYTLGNLYDYIASGTALTVQTGFQGPIEGPGSTMKSTRQIGDALKTSFDLCATTTAANVESGKPFFSTQSGSWGVQTGTLNIVDVIYPVGTIYTSVVSTSPATLFGGTWAAFATGRVLVGIDSADTDFDVVEETRGEKTHALSVAELASHTHTQNAHGHTVNQTITSAYTTQGSTDWGARYGSPEIAINRYGNVGVSINNATATNQNTGSGTAHNTIQPSIVVYMWKRIA